MNRTAFPVTAVLAAVALVLTAVALAAAAQAQSPAQAPTAEEIVIKEKLRASGVSQISGLTRERNGTWRGHGRKDNVEVAVVVDTDGNVKLH